jgi:hypothetical protein
MFPARRSLRLAILLGVGAAASCTENLGSSAGCPLLCPNQNLEIREALLDAISLDATVEGFPPRGGASFFTIAQSGDSLDTRLVIRFDSLPTTYSLSGVPQVIESVDSSHIRIFVDSSITVLRDDLSIELYDVDTTAADDNLEAVAVLFRPDRLIGSLTSSLLLVGDTIDIPLSNEVLLAKIRQLEPRLRVGLRLRSDSTARLAVLTANQIRFPRLRFDPAPENIDVVVLERLPRSLTPAGQPDIAIDFTDYVLPLAGPFPLVSNAVGGDTVGVFRDSVLAIAGVAGRRAYFRFEIPDSVLRGSIIRTTLIVHQKPASTFSVLDTLSVIPVAVFATHDVPPSRAARLVDTVGVFAMPAVRLEPRNSGETRFEMVNFSRTWNAGSNEEIAFAIVLRAGQEGRNMHEILFYSTTAPANLRPRLRITYIPRDAVGG